jgi:phage terminase small subunit
MALTPKQEAFAQAIVTGVNQSDAYRAAYKVRPGTKAESVNVAASKLMADAKVTQRVAELRLPIAKKAQITLESHLEDLQRLRNMAVKAEQFGAAITAEVARGKAAGIVVEKGSINLTNSDGSLRPTVITIRAKT